MSTALRLDQLRNVVPLVLPSLLLCDFGNLEREVGKLKDAGVQALHLDVMDGVFVPNLTYGMPIVDSLRRLTDMPLDVHLMIANPDQYIQQFYDAGADVITIHVEAVDDPRPVLSKIHELGAGVGIALNPDTPLESIDGCHELCDLILVMSVNAGFGGQEFNPIALEKLRALRQRVGDNVLLEVDGGINQETIRECADAGARMFVVGSAIFRNENYNNAVEQLTRLATV